MILGWFWGRKRCIRLKKLKMSPTKQKRGTTITFPSRFIEFHKNYHKILPKALEGLQKSKIAFSRKNLQNHWNPIGKTRFREPVKTHAKSIGGVAKNEHFLRKGPKKAPKSITLCAKITSGITFPKYIVILVISCVFGERKWQKMCSESIILCAEITSGITFPKYLVIPVVSWVFWRAGIAKKGVRKELYCMQKSYGFCRFRDPL